MIEKIKKFITRLKQDRIDQDIDDGFAWCMVAYYRKNMTIQEIENHVQMSRDFKTYNHHDVGVEIGLFQIEINHGVGE